MGLVMQSIKNRDCSPKQQSDDTGSDTSKRGSDSMSFDEDGVIRPLMLRDTKSAGELSVQGSLKSPPADPQLCEFISTSRITTKTTTTTTTTSTTRSSSSKISPVSSVSALMKCSDSMDTSGSAAPAATAMFLKQLFPTFNISKQESLPSTEVQGLNRVFHNLFKTIPKNEELVADYECVLSRGFPYQGRMYVTNEHLCFNTNLLGWIARVQVSFEEIISIERVTGPTGLYNDEICVCTKMGRMQFSAFISIDITFNQLERIWRRVRGRDIDDAKMEQIVSTAPENLSMGLHSILSGISALDTIRKLSNPPSRASRQKENDACIEDAIRSIDDVTDSEIIGDDDTGMETHDNHDLIEKIPIYRLKKDSEYEFDGPYTTSRTGSIEIPKKHSNEFVLGEFVVNAPPALVFEILFSDSDHRFTLEFFESQEGSQFSEIGSFDQITQSREYSFIKELGFPVGPKHTRCNIEEKILQCDSDNYIEVTNTTKTPDVPSGNSFATISRYLIQWEGSCSSKITVSYWVEWTSSSWIKSMIESSCKTGLESSYSDFVSLLNMYIEENTEKDFISCSSSEKKQEPENRLVEPLRDNNDHEPSILSQSSFEKQAADSTVSQVAKPAFYELKLSSLIIIFLLVLNIIVMLRLITSFNTLRQEIRPGVGGPMYELPARPQDIKLIKQAETTSLLKSLLQQQPRAEFLYRLLTLFETH